MLALLLCAVAAPPLTLGEAVETALARSPAVTSAREDVATAVGAREEARAPFDWYLSSSASHNRDQVAIDLARSQRIDVSSAELAVEKRFRLGTTVRPHVRLIRTAVGGDDDSFVVNLAQVGVEVVQPLLRGLGGPAHAQEDAARILAAAAGRQQAHAVSQQILAVASAYWSYRAAQEQLDATIANEARTRRLLERTTALVDAEQLPAADLVQIEANLAERARERIEAELGLLAARTELGVQMGVSASEVDAMGPPATAFVVELDAGTEPALVALAEANRQDVAAAALTVDALGRLADLEDDARLPALDLVVGAGFSSLDERATLAGYLGAFGGKVPGLDMNAALRLTWPIANHAADGRYAQAIAARRRAEIGRDDARRRAEAEVRLTRRWMEKSAEALALASKVAELYEKSVTNETRKVGAGLSTIIDVIQTQDRYFAAVQSRIASQRALANAVLRLRFATGTLVERTEDGVSVDPARLLTTPKGI